MSVTTAAGGAAAAFIGWKILDSKFQIASDIDLLRRISPVKNKVLAGIQNNLTVADWFESSVDVHKNKEFIISESNKYTFVEMDEFANQIAHWALSAGLKKGDVVSIFMENSAEYVATYIALAKIGVVCALINHNLRLKGLAHCINVSESKAVIFSSSLSEAISQITSDLKNCSRFLFYGENSTLGESLVEQIKQQPKTRPSKSIRQGIGLRDRFAFIYTSGTTGLPKAALIPHQRMYLYGLTMVYAYKLTNRDRIFCVLPLYHSAACLGVGAAIEQGITIVIRKKFSASTFWKDASENKATVVQYIGELCRYLLNTSPGTYDKQHQVRIAIGNGLRPEIWGPFQERFNIAAIGEFYGSTEGNSSLINLSTDKESRGAVGRHGALVKKLIGMHILKFDVETEEVIRGKDGLCIPCKPGEAGELVSVIDEHNPLSRFDGYTDKKASDKKIIKDVLVKGDKYFRTGDLLMRDARGYYYFVDRIGDTFRWKGENVSTTEVAEVLSVFPNILEANVYGAQIPGKDGRACMAALVVKDKLDFAGLLKHCKSQLPSYAVPMFIRLLPQMDITGTFKHQKVELRKQGINLNEVKDPIYWLNPEKNSYEPFDSNESVKLSKAKL